MTALDDAREALDRAEAERDALAEQVADLTALLEAAKRAQGAKPRDLYRADFHAAPLGQLNAARGRAVFGPTYKRDSDYAALFLVEEPNRGQVLRVALKANMVGSASGVNLFLPLAERAERVRVSYDVCVPRGFDWSGGGKLPGIIATPALGSPSIPTGCKGDPGTAGSSLRLMWHTAKAGWKSILSARPNTLDGVAYHPGQKDPCGDHNFAPRQFFDGQWHHVEMTMGLDDGTFVIDLDGEMCLSMPGYRWRDSDAVKGSHLVLSVFRGGSDLTRYGSPTASHIDLDNLAVTTA